MQDSILTTVVKDIDGEVTTLEKYAGNVLLIVNVASKCGLTPQYEQLENIQKAWADRGFVVLGFPCNQFLEQEPGSDEEIKTYCTTTWGVTFPMFSKIEVNGEGRHPLYQKLIAAAPTAVAPEEAGEILHLVGPNGAGKSTLLARMAGMTSGKGSIQFAGQPLEAWSATKLALHRAYLSQQQTPPFAMPVWHYLTLHQHDKTRTELLNDVAGALALDDKLGRSTNQLSGGEWQRVRLAAVVLQITPQANPAGQLLLLDEPMNSLDVAQQNALDKILSALCQQGLAIVMSSHDLNHTLRHAHRAWLLKGGKMLASGRREEVLTPANLAQAYGMNFRRLDIEGHRMLISTI